MSAKHAANLDAFGHAFLGATGPPGAIKEFFTEVAKLRVTDSVRDSMTVMDYVRAGFIERVGYDGDVDTYFVKHGMDKLPPDTAEDISWQYSEQGAALGAVYPQLIRRMFDQAYKTVPKADWERARTAGLDIPPEQDPVSYEEMEKGEHEAFMAYCQECCPELYAILSK